MEVLLIHGDPHLEVVAVVNSTLWHRQLHTFLDTPLGMGWGQSIQGVGQGMGPCGGCMQGAGGLEQICGYMRGNMMAFHEGSPQVMVPRITPAQFPDASVVTSIAGVSFGGKTVPAAYTKPYESHTKSALKLLFRLT